MKKNSTDIKLSPKQKKQKQDVSQPTFYQAVGRRKESTARVRLYVVPDGSLTLGSLTVKSGDIIVNDKPAANYFSGEVNKKYYLEPLKSTNTLDRFAVTSRISGGGLVGQLGAFILGISRALEKVDKEKYRPLLKKKGFLTRDPRMKERRKAGLAQKARAKKQSPKR